MPQYRISGPFWDGKQLHPAGSICEFPEGDAPPRSKLLEDEKPKAKAAAKQE